MGSVSMRGAVVAIGVALVLAACSDDPVPKEPDTTAAPTSSSASPATTPPPLPEEAKAATMAAAANFSVHWMAVSDFAALSGNTEPLAQISSDECKACDSYIELYESVHARGGAFTGGEHVLSDVATQASDDGKIVLVRARDNMKQGTMQSSSGAAVKTEPASENDVTFRVERDGERWVMAEFFAE